MFETESNTFFINKWCMHRLSRSCDWINLLCNWCLGMHESICYWNLFARELCWGKKASLVALILCISFLESEDFVLLSTWDWNVSRKWRFCSLEHMGL